LNVQNYYSSLILIEIVHECAEHAQIAIVRHETCLDVLLTLHDLDDFAHVGHAEQIVSHEISNEKNRVAFMLSGLVETQLADVVRNHAHETRKYVLMPVMLLEVRVLLRLVIGDFGERGGQQVAMQLCKG